VEIKLAGINQQPQQGIHLACGPFYKDVTTRGPLPTKWCMKQKIQKI